MCVPVCVRETESVCVCVCVCVKERERERQRERERERENVRRGGETRSEEIMLDPTTHKWK